MDQAIKPHILIAELFTELCVIVQALTGHRANSGSIHSTMESNQTIPTLALSTALYFLDKMPTIASIKPIAAVQMLSDQLSGFRGLLNNTAGFLCYLE